MSNRLADALKNPAMVIQAGPSTAPRNSTKKAKGLLPLMGYLMIGAAVLSPFNALAQKQQNIETDWTQTTEQVQGVEGVPTQYQEMTREQVDQMVANGQDPDWFGISVEGRTWHSWSQTQQVPRGVSVDVVSWVHKGQINPNAETTFTQDAMFNEAPDPIEIGDGTPKEHAPARQETERDYAAEREAREVSLRVDAPSFRLDRNEYNWYKSHVLGDSKFEDATPQQQEEFVQRLVKDAYIEMKAGHSVEAPSQRLIDICQNVEDIAKVQGPSTQIPHSQETFAACHSEQMQSNMFANSVKKGLGYVGVGVAGLAAATVSAASFLGAAVLGGIVGSPSNPQDKTGFSSRLAARRAENEPDPDPKLSNKGMKMS